MWREAGSLLQLQHYTDMKYDNILIVAAGFLSISGRDILTNIRSFSAYSY